MTVLESFTELQGVVDADPAIVATARERRDIFKSALLTAADVQAVWGSGSLARSTQLQPVHDVDLVVEFDPREHPEWGQPGDSAEEAIERCRDLVTEMLSVNRGTKAQLVRQVNTADRNRAAKCFIDDPADENAFTVDVMPALWLENGILIPSKRSRRWDAANPRFLIEDVAAHHAEWPPALADAPGGAVSGDPLFRAEASGGVCRVICFSPDHGKSLPLLRPAQPAQPGTRSQF